jgi:hypothetical protein
MRSSALFASSLNDAFLPTSDQEPEYSDLEAQEDALKPFLQWFHTEYKYSPIKVAGGVFGSTLAVVSCFSALPLGINFGSTIAQAVNANKVVTVILQCGFGFAAYGPTAILVRDPNYHAFRNLAGSLACEPQLPTRKDFKKSRRAAMSLAHFNSAFAGLPFYYLMNSYLINVPVVKFLFPGTALIGGYMATISVERLFVEDLFLQFAKNEENTIKLARKRLLSKVTSAQDILKAATNAEIKFLSTAVKSHLDRENFFEDDVLAILKILLNDIPSTAINIESQEIAEEPACSSWKKYSLDIFGAAMGASANYVMYALSKTAAQLFLDYAGVKDEALDNYLDTIAAVIATIPNMCFSAAYAQKDARRIYEALAERKFFPSAQSSAAHIISAFSAVPETYIAMKAATNDFHKAIIPATFIGTTMARALAFNMLLDTIIHACNKNSPRARKAELVSMLNRLERGIAMLAPPQLLALDAALAARLIEAVADNNEDESYDYSSAVVRKDSAESDLSSVEDDCLSSQSTPSTKTQITRIQALIDGVTPSPFPIITPDADVRSPKHDPRKNRFFNLQITPLTDETDPLSANQRVSSAPAKATTKSSALVKSNSLPLLFKSASDGHLSQEHTPSPSRVVSASRNISSLMVSKNQPSTSPSLFESSTRDDEYSRYGYR